MSRILILLLLLVSMVYAQRVAPTLIGDKDFGNGDLEEMRYAISAQCKEATVDLMVFDREYKRVPSAKTYLTYVDYEAKLLATNYTDSQGFRSHKLPGNPRFMRGLFILLIEKEGFRNQEIYFTIDRCYG